jgi:hypothetical protein
MDDFLERSQSERKKELKGLFVTKIKVEIFGLILVFLRSAIFG